MNPALLFFCFCSYLRGIALAGGFDFRVRWPWRARRGFSLGEGGHRELFFLPTMLEFAMLSDVA
jgi:hypothetical protein